MAVTPSSGARFFSQLYGTQHGAPAFQYLFDSGIVWNDTNNHVRTGAMRPITPDDFANVVVSGLTFSGSLEVNTDSLEALTLTGIRYESGISGLLAGGINVAVTGTASVNSQVANALASGISGQLAGTINVSGNLNTGAFGFNSSAITGSQTTIPAGSWSYSVYVESGVASVNGITYNTFETIAGGGYDGQKRLSSAINVGCTGSAAAPCRVLLSWEL